QWCAGLSWGRWGEVVGLMGEWWRVAGVGGIVVLQVGGKMRLVNSRQFKRGRRRSTVWSIYTIGPCGLLRTYKGEVPPKFKNDMPLRDKKHFKSLSLDELRSPDFSLFSDQEYLDEEKAETMAETMEQYMSKTRTYYESGVARPKIDNKDKFELKCQFLKELRENTFSGSDHEDVNEYIEKVLEIVDLFHEPTGSIKTCEDLKTNFLNKYCPPGRTANKMKEINNFQQESDETLYQAWEHFKELLMKCPQHYLTEMHEVIFSTMDWMSQHDRFLTQEVSGRSTKISDGLAAIQAQLNNLGREIKKVNEKVYAAQVGYE
nr:hypothetical protein [Tanacetum cinerariifolium]